MSETSNIEWCDSTFNPWIGCTKVSPACDNCYAEVSTASRSLGVVWGPRNSRHRTSIRNWDQPLKWERDHERFFAAHGRRRRVFCASLADVFDNEVPASWRMDLFSLISQTPNLDWLILTKRISNVMPMCSGDGLMFDMICNRVWLGITVCNQIEANRDIDKLLNVPAAIRFLSMEPLLNQVSFEGMWVDHPDPAYHENMLERIDWIIVGGESGHNARPMHPQWVRIIRDQCEQLGVPFFFKQWGEFTPGELAAHPSYPDDRGAWRLDQTGQRWHDAMESLKPAALWTPVTYRRVGKTHAGRLLDGRTHDEYPEVIHETRP